MSDDSSRHWLSIKSPPSGATTSAQEQAIRDFARDQYGYQNLRGFHAFLRSQGWDYYDILKEAYDQA